MWFCGGCPVLALVLFTCFRLAFLLLLPVAVLLISFGYCLAFKLFEVYVGLFLCSVFLGYTLDSFDVILSDSATREALIDGGCLKTQPGNDASYFNYQIFLSYFPSSILNF